MASSKPKLAMGTKKAVGTKMECPTCGFKWSRPPGEENKPCPKCFKPLPKNAGGGGASPAKAPVSRPKAASTSTPSPPKPKPAQSATSEAPASSPAVSSLPANSGVGTGAKVGYKMECPTCGFKWTRPPGEEHKPCPKCFKPLPKSAVIKKVSISPTKTQKKGPSIFDKLTDPKQYTGAHKQRFDSEGKGRGIAGRTG